MKPALTIAELAEVATFGANKLKKAALENTALSAIIAYDIIKGGKVLRVETKAPNPVNEETPIRRFLELEKNEDNKQFFADIENGNYLAHGELRLTEFTDVFLEQYFKKIEAVFGYGTEPQLDKVIHNGKGDATVVFSSVKDGKRVNHNASWTLTDIKDDFDKTVLIPRSLFKSYNEFMTLFCEAIGQPKDRFFLKDDPMEVKGEGIDVYVEGTDLVYYGKLTVSLPWSGTEVNVIDNGYVPPEEPDEGGEEPGEDGEQPGTGGETPTDPEPPVTEQPKDNKMTVVKSGNTLTLNFERAVLLDGSPLEAYNKDAVNFIKATAVPVKDLELFDMALVPANIGLTLTATSATLTLNPGFFDKEVFTMLDDSKTGGVDAFKGNDDGIYRVDFNMNKDAFVSADQGAIVSSGDLAVKITVFTDVSKTVTQHTAEDYANATILGVFGAEPVYPA